MGLGPVTLEVRPQVGGYQEIRLQPPLVPPDLLQISDTDMICDQTGARGRGGGRPWNIETWRTFKTAIQLFRTVLWIKDIEFLTGQEFIFYSVCFKVKVFTLTISLAHCSCPVLWKYIPHFHFCVRVQSPCLGVLTFLSVSVFS